MSDLVAAPRILIADDHELIRDALPGAIRRRLPTATFESVATASAVITAAQRERWDLLVLDLGLPGMGELDTLRRVRALQPALPVLVLSMFAEEKMGVAALEAGADGYLCKTADRNAIAHAAAETLAGRGHVSENLRSLLARRPRRPGGSITALSPREVDVLLDLGRGLSNKEIAARLAVGVTTVATYRARIMEKLALRTAADLHRFVIEQELTRH